MTAPRVVTVIQARSASTRLPGKVLLPLGGGGLSVLEVMLGRVRRAKLVGTVVVATTTEPRDASIAAVCARAGVPCFRGHPTDLLDRHYQAARVFRATHVVKIPSDCPLIDPAIIDEVLDALLSAGPTWDYASNLHPATHPDGNDVEVFRLDALAAAWREAARALDREHTTPFLWDNPERFRLRNVTWQTGRDLSASHRVVLDYLEDYEVIRRVHDALAPRRREFGVADVVDYLDANPAVAAINAHHRGSSWMRQHLHELKTMRDASHQPRAQPEPA